jgi:hypothetical protein
MPLLPRISGLALLSVLGVGALVACSSDPSTEEGEGSEEAATAEESALTSALVPRGSVWRFFDAGVAPSGAWTTAGFGDSTWKQGPAQIGYGDGDEKTIASYGTNASRKYTTTYFRKTFSVADAARITDAALELLRDDGAIVYLNGKEIFRSNMPSGAVSYGTFASAPITGAAENTWVKTTVPASAFVTGTNVLAVEVHQFSLTTEDLSFDLGLTANTTDAPAPTPVPSTSPCFPFEKPSVSALRGTTRKVFAHYFSPYPVSLDNALPEQDYYARHYLVPTGESGKFAYCGGLLKQRPLPQAPRASGVDYQVANFEEEIRRAIAVGVDGFTYDILNSSGTHWTRLLKLLDAAKNVDPGFKIVLMPDMTAAYDQVDDLGVFVSSIASVAAHPSVYKTSDGKLLLSPFYADKQAPSWWSQAVSQLAAKGINAVLWPVYVTPWATPTKGLDAAVELIGTSSWGSRTVQGAASQIKNATDAHALGLKWMTSVAPQDTRPKDLVYTEANNTQAMRALWDAARTGNADWVQIVTWNDYSESTEVSPSSGSQWALFDLTAYYATWFKTGTAPTIVRDALYYSHRKMATTAAPDLTKQRAAYRVVNGAAPADEIELLAFLTAPATLKISIGGTTTTKDVGAGIQSFRVPLREGTPAFSAVRNGATIASVTSAFPISNKITYQDLLYRSGGSLTCDRAPLMK